MRIAVIFLLLAPFPIFGMNPKKLAPQEKDTVAAAVLKKLVEKLPEHASSSKALEEFATRYSIPIDGYSPLISSLEWAQANITREQLLEFSAFMTFAGIETYDDANNLVTEKDFANLLRCKPQPSSPRDLPEPPSFCPTSPRSLASQAPTPVVGKFWGATSFIKALTGKTT